MPLYAGELNLRRGASLEEYPAPMSEVLGAQATDTRINNPLSAIQRMQALSDAERGPYVGSERDQFGAVVPRFAPPPRLDAETARQRVKEEGLPLTIPDDGIAAPALDILIRAKRDELQRQNIFARGPSGVVPGALRLGTALINSLYDPLNIASAFIPVVGQARYAGMVAGATGAFGRAGVRAGVGAVEGLVGAAVLEPLIYAANQQEQADYGMADSLANIAFGGLFGGGLHAGGGAVRDLVQPGWWKSTPDGHAYTDAASIAARIDAETRQSATRASIVQAIEGRQTEIDAIVRADPNAESAPIRGFHGTKAMDIEVNGLSQSLDLGPHFTVDRSTAEIFASHLNTPGKVLEGDLHFRQVFDMPDLGGWQPWSVAQWIDEQGLTRSKPDENGNLGELGKAALRASEATGKPGSEEAKDAAAKVVRDWLRDRGYDAIRYKNQYEGRPVDTYIAIDMQRVTRPGERPLQVPAPATGDQVATAAQRVSQPDAVRSADPRSSAASEQTARQATPATLEAAQAQLDEAMTAADDFAAALGEPDRISQSLKDYDLDIKRAEDYAKALRAGAACGLA